MSKPQQIVCPACGHRNRVPLARDRCGSCGIDVKEWTNEKRRDTEPRFSLTWLAIAVAVTGVLTGTFVIGLPKLVQALDFEGAAGMVVTIPVWFCSGLLVGLISPFRTVAEPAAATALVAVPTVLFLIGSETVKTIPLFLYAMMAVLGVVFAVIGSHAGGRIQMGPPSPARDE